MRSRYSKVAKSWKFGDLVEHAKKGTSKCQSIFRQKPLTEKDLDPHFGETQKRDSNMLEIFQSEKKVPYHN